MSTDPEYDSSPYLQARGDNWFDADPLLGAWLSRSDLPEDDRAWLRELGEAAATRYVARAERVERRENLPRIREPDPYYRGGATEIELPGATWKTLAEVHGSRMWRADLDERARYAAVYLLNQNGEFGVTCSVACTDGLARVLRTHTRPEDTRSAQVLAELDAASPERWIHGAQFVTEIQGGSDAGTNRVQARPVDDGLYELSGLKWFCSNLTADYWLVTARPDGAPEGSHGLGLFCVPRRWEGAPNGYEIRRLKDKLGTRALPTAEVELRGARGWPVGPLDAGLKTMVSIVLTTSRVHNVLAAAGFLRRASREARTYADFRHAFGRPLSAFPLLGDSLRRVSEAADLAAAGAFATVDAWTRAMAPDADDTTRLWARVLVSVAKACATRHAVPHLYEAMMAMGGNGIEERFSAMPRLWRDGAIMETWEGPYTLLLAQALHDMARFKVAGREEAFLRHGLGDHLDPSDAADLAEVLQGPEDPARVRLWGHLAPRLWRAFEAHALAELTGAT